MKKYLYLILLILLVAVISSCDVMKSAINLIPSFDGNLPNVFSGRYALFENEEDRYSLNPAYINLFEFDSKTKTFKYEPRETSQIQEGIYEYKYTSYKITDAYGTLTLKYTEERPIKNTDENGSLETQTSKEESIGDNTGSNDGDGSTDPDSPSGDENQEENEEPKTETVVVKTENYSFKFNATADGPQSIVLYSDNTGMGKTYYYYR